MQINVFITVDVCAEGDVLTVRRELAATDFPFIFGKPFDRSGIDVSSLCALHADLKNSNVVVTVCGIGRDENYFLILAEINIVGAIKLLALVRR